VDLGIPNEPHIRWAAGCPNTTGKGAILPPPQSDAAFHPKFLNSLTTHFYYFWCATLLEAKIHRYVLPISLQYSSLTTVHHIDNKLSLWWQYTGAVCYEIRISAICSAIIYYTRQSSLPRLAYDGGCMRLLAHTSDSP